MQTFKQFLESEDPLKLLEVEMFFRHEFGFDAEMAKEAALWLTNQKDPDDMTYWDNVWERWEEHVNHMGQYEFQDYVYEQVAELALKKYGIEL